MGGEIAIAKARENASMLERMFGLSRDAHRVKKAGKFRQKAKEFDEEVCKIERKVEQEVRTKGMHGHMQREIKELLKLTQEFEKKSQEHTATVVELMRRLFVQLEESREGMLHVRAAMHKLSEIPDVKVRIQEKGKDGKVAGAREETVSLEALRAKGREHEARVKHLLRILEVKSDYFKNMGFDLRARAEHAQSGGAV